MSDRYDVHDPDRYEAGPDHPRLPFDDPDADPFADVDSGADDDPAQDQDEAPAERPADPEDLSW